MGYYMNLMKANFKIKKEDKDNALDAIKALGDVVDEKGSGGSWDNGSKTKSWYSWVDTDKFMKAETLEEAMKVWRWEVYDDKEGNIVDISFYGEKLGQDSVMFDAIAPYVQEGSEIEMSGEDGYVWRWYFDGKDCIEQEARIVYE